MQRKLSHQWQVYLQEEALNHLKANDCYLMHWSSIISLLYWFEGSFYSGDQRKMSPPPPTPASERSTKPRPTTQMAAPKNCHREYRVPNKSQVRTITHAIVQQSNNVTLVIDEYSYALLTAVNCQAVNIFKPTVSFFDISRNSYRRKENFTVMF